MNDRPEDAAVAERLRSGFLALWPDDRPSGDWVASVMARTQAAPAPTSPATPPRWLWAAAAGAFLSLSAWTWDVIFIVWKSGAWASVGRPAAALLDALALLFRYALPRLDQPAWVIAAAATALLAGWAFRRIVGDPRSRPGMEGWSR